MPLKDKVVLNKRYPNETPEEMEKRLAKQRIRAARYREKNKMKIKERGRQYYKNNRDQCVVACTKWRNENRERKQAMDRLYKKNNRGRQNAHCVRRRAAKLQRSPGWVTKEEKKAIEELYTEAERRTKATGIQHDVHHIYHLQGKTISGLHVLKNLAIMSKKAHQECHSRNSLL